MPALSLPLKHRTVHWGRAETVAVTPTAGHSDSSQSEFSEFKYSSSSPDSGGGVSSRGDSSCISALSLEPAGRWADYTPKPWEDDDRTSPQSEASSARRKKPPQISISFANDSGTPAASLPSETSRPTSTTSNTTKSVNRLGTFDATTRTPHVAFDATPTPWGDSSVRGFGRLGTVDATTRTPHVAFDATPTPWGDSSVRGFGISRPSPGSRPSPWHFGTKSFHRLGSGWDATPTPWADPVTVGFGIQGSRENLDEAEKSGDAAASQKPQCKADMFASIGWPLLPTGAHVPVKRTFIDGLPEELPAEQPGLQRTNSAPGLIGLKPYLFTPEQTPQVTPRLLPEPPGLGTPKSEMVMCNITNEGVYVDVPSGPLPSVGSASHGVDCKPCAWFHKPQGCFRGQACRHCHICDSNELKKRKTGKVAVLKAQAKGEKLNQQAQALYWEAHNLIYKANMISAHSSMLVQPVPYAAQPAAAGVPVTRLPLSSLV